MGSQYVDLTGTLSPEMWSYRPLVPDVPPFEQRRWATIPERGWESDWFAMPTLAGTYLETGKHLFEDFPSIDEIPVERLFLNAVVAHIPKGPAEHITRHELESAGIDLEPGDALLIDTGWDQHWWDDGSVFVMQSPHFEMSAMHWIVDKGISILGGDVPCFDDPIASQAEGVNTILFESGAMILAPLVNLSSITQPRIHLTVLPIPLKGACGSACRAIATIENQE
jgi:arylformamidase